MTATAAAKRRPHLSYVTSPVIYRIMRVIIGTLMRIVYRYQVQELAPFPTDGPTIVVVNHVHMFDPGAVMPAVPRKVVTLAAGKWRRNFVISAILRMAGVIFVRRGEADRQALRSCLDVLSRGWVLAVAPEGTRSRTAQLQRAKPGVAYLATRTNATLVPIAVWGVERLGDWLRLKRPTCNVVVGRPFRLHAESERPSAERLQELADKALIEVARLLPEAYRGVYADAVAAGAGD